MLVIYLIVIWEFYPVQFPLVTTFVCVSKIYLIVRKIKCNFISQIYIWCFIQHNLKCSGANLHLLHLLFISVRIHYLTLQLTVEKTPSFIITVHRPIIVYLCFIGSIYNIANCSFSFLFCMLHCSQDPQGYFTSAPELL